MRPHSRGAMRPRLASDSPSLRTEGAGKAGCRLHPRSCVQKTHEWTTGSTGSLRLSPHEWFTAYFALSPVSRALLPPSPADDRCIRTRSGGYISAELDASFGRQNDTTSPSAPASPKVLPDLVPSGQFRRRQLAAPSVRAPVDRSRKIPPCNPVCARHCRVHRIPPRVRDDSRSAPCRVRRASL